ncbi:MAG: hypothetical protein WBE68_11605 [Candidatus Nitrosopolaris sp.]
MGTYRDRNEVLLIRLLPYDVARRAVAAICYLYTNTKRDEFSIDEIIQVPLGGYSMEYVFQFITKFENQSRHIELVAQDRIRLTDAGKKYCNSF